jgi:hypothetical protein
LEPAGEAVPPQLVVRAGTRTYSYRGLTRCAVTEAPAEAEGLEEGAVLAPTAEAPAGMPGAVEAGAAAREHPAEAGQTGPALVPGVVLAEVLVERSLRLTALPAWLLAAAAVEAQLREASVAPAVREGTGRSESHGPDRQASRHR